MEMSRDFSDQNATNAVQLRLSDLSIRSLVPLRTAFPVEKRYIFLTVSTEHHWVSIEFIVFLNICTRPDALLCLMYSISNLF